MKADGAGPDPEQPRPSSAADDRLRLRASTNLDEIVGTALEAFVPGFADAAVVYATESLLLGGASGSARPVRQDAAGRITVRRAGARFAWGGPDADAFPPGEAVVFVPGSPYVRCVNDGTSVAFTGPDGRTLDGVSPGSREVISRYA